MWECSEKRWSIFEIPTCMQTGTKGKETAVSASLNRRNKPRRMFTPEQPLAMVRECPLPRSRSATA